MKTSSTQRLSLPPLLSSLLILPLFVSVSSQLALALAAIIPLFIVYSFSALSFKLIENRLDSSLHSLVRCLLAVLFSFLSQLLISLALPFFSFSSQFSFSFIPLAYMGTWLEDKKTDRDTLDTFFDAALDAFSLSLLLLTASLVREFVSSFSLSIPSSQGIVYLFRLEALSDHAPGVLAGSTGAFILFVCLRLLLCRRDSLPRSLRRLSPGIRQEGAKPSGKSETGVKKEASVYRVPIKGPLTGLASESDMAKSVSGADGSMDVHADPRTLSDSMPSQGEPYSEPDKAPIQTPLPSSRTLEGEEGLDV